MPIFPRAPGETIQTSVEDFERQYAARSGVTVQDLHAMGRYGQPCDCGDESCDGFQMAYRMDDA